jgi:hypothetical protein
MMQLLSSCSSESIAIVASRQADDGLKDPLAISWRKDSYSFLLPRSRHLLAHLPYIHGSRRGVWASVLTNAQAFPLERVPGDRVLLDHPYRLHELLLQQWSDHER